MSNVLLVEDDRPILDYYERILADWHTLFTATSCREAMERLSQRAYEVILLELCLPDCSGLDVLKSLRRHDSRATVVVVGGAARPAEAATAIQLGASEFLEKPVSPTQLLNAIDAAARRVSAPEPRGASAVEAHAAARVARAVVPLLDPAHDPRTLQAWSRIAYSSPGALRNWCHTAGLTSRTVLLFGRLMRATAQSDSGKHAVSSLLDFVDRRTLVSILRRAGFNNEADFPKTVDEFLQRQALIRDDDFLKELIVALQRRDAQGVQARANNVSERVASDHQAGTARSNVMRGR
jgi:CheY-like chemotaxis protein